MSVTEIDKHRTHAFFTDGWCQFEFDPVLAAWVDATLPAARAAVVAPEHAEWHRCGGTWFAGVNALGNDAAGAVQGGLPLDGDATRFIREQLGIVGFDWEPAQVSVCYPGYPQPMDSESDAAFRYRRNRDAAHVDGLIPEGPQRRRHLREHHGFLLGIPMTVVGDGASPLVIWRGSHNLIRQAFVEAFEGLPAERWGDVDVTETYQTVRREIVDTCERVVVSARPGEAYLVHRLALHGVAPWAEWAGAGEDGRMIAYFRPEIGGAGDWLSAP